MKKIIYSSLVVLVITSLFSCKSNENSIFSKRKYYHFKNGATEVVLNKPATNHSKAIAINAAKDDIEITNTANFSKILLPAQTSSIATEIKANNLKTAKVNRALTNINAIEKNEKIQEVKKSILPLNQNTTNNSSSSAVSMVVLVILAILLPPLAVFLKEGSIGTNFWIDLLLSLLFWVPGIIFAFLVILDVI